MSEGGSPRAATAVTAVVSGVLGLCALLCVCGGVGSALAPESVSSPSAGAAESLATATASPVTRTSSSGAAGASPSRRATPSPSPSSKPTHRVAPALARTYAVTGITDGDTIKVRIGSTVERIRVIGIDTPELRPAECFGQQASSTMQSLVQSRRVGLRPDPTQDDRDRYGRLLRHVVLPDGRLAAQVLIEGGFGREYTYDRVYAHRDAYVAAERRAKASGRGMWSSGCAAGATPAPAPAAPPVAAAPAAPGACTIKGNISSSGERIYHVPGGGSYAATVITEAKGERLFCSEAEAVVAGWRRARN